MAGGLTIERVDACFGAHIHDTDIAAIDDATFAALRELLTEFGLLVFPSQHITLEAQNAFAARFGPLEFPAAAITNIAPDGSVLSDQGNDTVKSIRGNEGWHHDSTYMPVQAFGAVVSAEIVPPDKAPTGFADMRAAFDALDTATREQLRSLRAQHSLYYSQGRAGYLPTPDDDGRYAMYGYHDEATPIRPLVKVHPDTGLENLLVGRHAHDIDGMDPVESERFLDELNEAACSDDRVHYHEWNVGDVVVWDNRRLMHRATEFDLTHPRRIWHTRIAGNAMTEAAENHRPSVDPT